MNSNIDRNEGAIEEEVIDLKELLIGLWGHKTLMILVTSFFAMSSIFYSLTLTNYYQSIAVLNTAGQSNSNSSLSGLGGLASIAGINLPANDQNKSTLAMKIIQSRAFFKHLITFENILPSIVAAKSFDFESKKIQFDPKIYNKEDDKWVRKPQKNRQPKPSYLEAYDTYLEQVSISQDKVTNFITISFEHISPIFAKEFLDLIISETNELLRNQDLNESTDAIAFLISERPKSSLISMQDAINQLVQSKLETQMMAKISTEYVLKIIEPPFVPEKKSRPNRSIVVILGTLLGGIFATLWVLIRSKIKAI